MNRDDILELAAKALTLTDQKAMRSLLGAPYDQVPYSYEPYYPFLHLLASSGRFQTVVELGTWKGGGTLHLAYHKPVSVTTVDKTNADWMVENLAGPLTNVKRVIAPTVPVPAGVPEAIDLLFIDADHTYEGVMGDLHAYLPRMTPGGVVALDDIHYNSESRPWAWLREQYGDRAVELNELHWPGFGAVLL